MSIGLKISVIIPTYNQGQFIEETILSIINQTYKNFEIIVIDGGSNDSTLDILRKYQTHFTYWISEKDSGQSEAINKGLAVASGDIITWLNSDDYYEPDALQIINSEFLKEPRVSIIHGKAILFGENVPDRVIGLAHDIPFYEYLAYMRFPQPSSFLRREVFETVGNVNPELHFVMDFDLVARAILAGFQVKRIDPILSHYRMHQLSKSNDHLSFSQGWSDVVYGIFNSVANGKKFARKMERLQLVNTKGLIYQSSIDLGSNEQETIFLLHLNNYYHSHYLSLHRKECLRISAFLKQHYKAFYMAHNFKKYNFRLRFIPAFAFKLFRAHN